MKIESSKKGPNKIVQCLRCQNFGYTKNYCFMSMTCMRCRGGLDNGKYNKPKEAKPNCVFYEEVRLANHRGCLECSVKSQLKE